MRDIRLAREGEWLVLVLTGTRAGTERIRRVFLRRDEAAMVVSLLTRELGEVKMEARPDSTGRAS